VIHDVAQLCHGRSSLTQTYTSYLDFFNVAKGSFNGLKCFFSKKRQTFVGHFYFMSCVCVCVCVCDKVRNMAAAPINKQVNADIRDELDGLIIV